MSVKESAPEMALFHIVDRKPVHVAKAIVDLVEEIAAENEGFSYISDARRIPSRLMSERNSPRTTLNGRIPSLKNEAGSRTEIQFGIHFRTGETFLSGGSESAEDATRKTAYRIDELAGKYEEQEKIGAQSIPLNL